MDIALILTHLREVEKIGNEGCKTSQSISNATKITTDFIDSHINTRTEPKLAFLFEEFSSEFCNDTSWKHDERLLCAVNSLYLLNCVLIELDETVKDTPKNVNTPSGQSAGGYRRAPEPPPDLISLQHKNTIEGSVKYILYSSYFGSLDEDAAMYMKIMQEHTALADILIQIPSKHHHGVLRLTLKYLLPLIQNKWIGACILQNLFPEILCGLLQLCFAPEDTSDFPQDVPVFRQELEGLFNTISRFETLKGILLLKGATAQKKGKCWLRTVCQSLYVRRFLLTENGVRHVLEAALSVGDFGDWRKKEVVAALISSVKTPDENHFFEIVCPQILTLLKELEKNGNNFQILAFSVCQLAKRSAQLAQTHFFKPLLAPLANLTTTTELPNSVRDQDLIPTVSILYKIYVQVLPPSAELGSYLKPVLCPLTSVASLPPTCHVKTDAQMIIVRYLSQLKTDEAVSSLLILAELEDSEVMLPVKVKLVSRMNEIEVETCSDHHEWMEEDEKRVKSLTEIIDQLKSSAVVIEMLRRLTVYLDFTVLNEVELRSNELLTEADINDRKVGKLRRLTLVVGLLTAITERGSLIDSLFSDLASALPVVEALLETHRQRCSDDELALTRETFLINCVMLLSCYVTERGVSGQMTSSDWRALKDVVPTLKHLKSDSHNAALTGLIEQLLQMVLTHGVVGTKSQCDAENASKKNSREQLPTTASSSKSSPAQSKPSPSFASTSPTKPMTEQPGSLTSYQEALLDVCSVHLPVRGHGLIALTKLVQTADKDAMKNSKKILSLFEHHLRDEDSYIYLASIEGLVALSARFPDKVVAIVTEEFARRNQTIETRLKLVEILTKTTRCLGQMLPKYKSLFLNCLLNGVKDEDALIRASCLSNLGEVCKELRFSVGSILHEILSLVENVIQNDKSIEVKRAAVLLVTLLLQGLGKDSLKVLQTVILDIYRSLKRLASTHSDSALVTQAELAIEEINSITKEFLLPKINLSKKIFVTEVPSDFL